MRGSQAGKRKRALRPMEWVFVGRDIHVYPEGYEREYRQQIYPGDNKVYLPCEFAHHGGNLVFKVSGTRAGAWALYYQPGLDNYDLESQ